MSKSRIPNTLRRQVAKHFKNRCAFCQTQQEISGIKLTIDHIIPELLGGKTEFGNLCLACWDCNITKSTYVTGIDPLSGETVRLFHPNNQTWSAHFQWSEDGLLIVGISPIGRATVATLGLNRVELVHSRQYWTRGGWHPPTDD